MSVPAFILRRLYVKGSLRNVENGFEFSLRNVLADAELIKPLEIYVDDTQIPLENVTLIAGTTSISNKDIAESNPVKFSLNMTATIRVDGARLEPGEHKITLVVTVKGYGTIKFDVRDVLSSPTS